MKRSELKKINQGTHSITTGKNSKAIMGMYGCDNCPHRDSCAMYSPLEHSNKTGCAARQRYLVDMRREIGNVDSNLMGRALVLREELEAEAVRIRKNGESPIRDKDWRDAYKVDLELAKFLVKLKHGTKHTHRIERDDEVILVSEDAQKKKKED